MKNYFRDRWKVLVFYIWMVSDANSLKTQHIKEVTEDCLYGQYKDGDVCKECPAGYIGKNCSQKCTPPSYGVLCGEICSCSTCHHAVGCMSTPEFTVNECPAGYFGFNCSRECDYPTYGIACGKICNCSSCHYVAGCISSSESTASDVLSEKGKETQPTGNRIFLTQVNLIILLTGGAITIVLLVLIFYTIRRQWSIVESNRNELASPNVHRIDTIYYDLNGPMI